MFIPLPISLLTTNTISSGSFQFLSPLSSTSTADSITVSWTPPELPPMGYMLNTICTWPCDDTLLPYTASTPGPTDTSLTITGLLPGSTCNITLTAFYGNVLSSTLKTQSETMACGESSFVTYLMHTAKPKCLGVNFEAATVSKSKMAYFVKEKLK